MSEALRDSEFEILKTIKGYVYLLPTQWKTAINKNRGNGVGFSLFFRLNFYNGKAELPIVLLGGEAAFREKISNVVKTAPELFRRTNLDNNWVTLHNELLEISDEVFEADEDEATKQLTDKTKAALKTTEMRERIARLSSVLDLEHFS